MSRRRISNSREVKAIWLTVGWADGFKLVWEGGWGRGRGEGRKGRKEWEQRGNTAERGEGQEEDGGVGSDGEPQKARVKGFMVVEGCGNPWWRIYWWSWGGWGCPCPSALRSIWVMLVF